MPEFTLQEIRTIAQWVDSVQIPLVVLDQEVFNLVTSVRTKLRAATEALEPKPEVAAEPTEVQPEQVDTAAEAVEVQSEQIETSTETIAEALSEQAEVAVEPVSEPVVTPDVV